MSMRRDQARACESFLFMYDRAQTTPTNIPLHSIHIPEDITYTSRTAATTRAPRSTIDPPAPASCFLSSRISCLLTRLAVTPVRYPVRRAIQPLRRVRFLPASASFHRISIPIRSSRPAAARGIDSTHSGGGIEKLGIRSPTFDSHTRGAEVVHRGRRVPAGLDPTDRRRPIAHLKVAAEVAVDARRGTDAVAR